ncbi:MAG: hypothetical protein ABSB79_12675 [Syntrophales bacterium]|jgi:hypothetical protein
MTSNTRKLVIFDYSGTLSIEAVRFGQPDRLWNELVASGIAARGVGDIETFWAEIVNPTWDEGSTTPAGYKKVMADAVMGLARRHGREIGLAELQAAVSSFVDSYMAHSFIAPGWKQILLEISTNPDAKLIVATDHYAEATPVFIGFLEKMGIKAVDARRAFDHTGSGVCVVANSADLGCHKVTAPFWTALHTILSLTDIHSILIVDDFGANEQTQDSYSSIEKVRQRMENTETILKEVFRAEIALLWFDLPLPQRQVILLQQQEINNMLDPFIEQASEAIHYHLSSHR